MRCNCDIVHNLYNSRVLLMESLCQYSSQAPSCSHQECHQYRYLPTVYLSSTTGNKKSHYIQGQLSYGGLLLNFWFKKNILNFSASLIKTVLFVLHSPLCSSEFWPLHIQHCPLLALDSFFLVPLWFLTEVPSHYYARQVFKMFNYSLFGHQCQFEPLPLLDIIICSLKTKKEALLVVASGNGVLKNFYKILGVNNEEGGLKFFTILRPFCWTIRYL